MKRSILILQSLALLLGVVFSKEMSQAKEPKVYVIEITHEVDLSLPPYIKRVLSEAKENNAVAVVLHVNTFGGRVDVATEIKDAVLNSPVPVVAFVDKRAISAGALITLSASKIAMAPGGTIGAATPIYESGEKASEKVVSYMRGEMRATAEHNKRDPKIAEAMVDENLSNKDWTVTKQGQLLTLTTEEALKVGYCDVEASTLQEALDKLGYKGVEIVRTETNWGESLVRFFTSPVMNSILIMLGLAGIFYGVKTGHVGSLTLIGVVSIALFFGAQYLADLTSAVEVLMFIGGVGLIALEVFVIPGHGVSGIIGAILIVASLFLSLIGNPNLISYDSITIPLYTLAASFVGLAILIALMIHYLPTSNTFKRFVLTTTESAPPVYISIADQERLLGAEGQALTTLRPAGLAMLGSQRFDVITDGEFISAGEEIRVVRIEGRKIVVGRLVEKGSLA